MLPYVSHQDVPDNLLADHGNSGGGLRCPDDPLETVMNNPGPDDGFLRQESASPPPPPPPAPAGGDDAVLVESAETVLPTDDGDATRRREDDHVCGLLFPGFMDDDIAMGLGGGGLGELFPPPPLGDLCNFFPEDMMVLTDMDYLDGGGLDAFGGGLVPALDDISGLFPVDDMALTDTGGGLPEFGGAPSSLVPPVSLLPAHAAPWSTSSVDTSTLSLDVCPSSSATWEREPEPVFALEEAEPSGHLPPPQSHLVTKLPARRRRRQPNHYRASQQS